MEEKNGFYLNIGDKKVFIEESEETKKKKHLESIVSKYKAIKEDTSKGFLYVSGVYIPYHYKVIFDDTLYFIDLSLAEGKHCGELKGYCGASVNGKYNNYDDFIDYITLFCKYDYKVITYDNINVIYIFNKKYASAFEDNNKYEDLD